MNKYNTNVTKVTRYKTNNPLTFKIHKPKRVTLKQLEERCNDLNNYFGYACKAYDRHGNPQRTYQIEAAYGGYRLEFWSGRGGCVDQTFRTTAGQLYTIIDSIMLGCTKLAAIYEN